MFDSSIPVWGGDSLIEGKIIINTTQQSSLISVLKNQSLYALPSGTKTFAIAVELPKGKQGDIISYKIADINSNIIIKNDVAKNELYGKEELWGIRFESTMIDIVSGNVFRNITKDIKYAPTPISSSVTGKNIFVISPITNQKGVFINGKYRLEINLNNKLGKTIAFVIGPDFTEGKAPSGAQVQSSSIKQPESTTAKVKKYIKEANELEWNRNYVEAIEVLRNGMLSDSNNALAYELLGRAFVSQGKYDEAITAFKESLRIEPKFFRAQYNIGVAYRHLGRDKEAQAAFNKANSDCLKPDPPHLQLAIPESTIKRAASNVPMSLTAAPLVKPNLPIKDVAGSTSSPTTPPITPSPARSIGLKKENVIEGTIQDLHFAQLNFGGNVIKSITLTLKEYPNLKIELPEAVVKSSNGHRESSWEGKKVKVKYTKESESKCCVAVEIKFL